MRVLVVLALAAIIIYLARGFIRRLQAARSSDSSAPSRRSQSSEPMRQCTHCGAYFPASEAVGETPELFCSEEHQRQHLSR